MIKRQPFPVMPSRTALSAGPVEKADGEIVAPLFQPQRQLILPAAVRVYLRSNMPAIMRVLDDFGPVQGPVGNKGFTDDKTPAISGYAASSRVWNGIPALPARSKKRMVRLWLPSSNRSGN
jgi:hypothetical protein